LNSPHARIPLRVSDREDLNRLARETGVPVADAMRRGAFAYYAAIQAPEYKRGRPRKEARAA